MFFRPLPGGLPGGFAELLYQLAGAGESCPGRDLVQTVSALGDGIDYDGTPYTVKQSDIRVSADGRFLYDCVRDANVLSVYAIDPERGTLTMLQCKHVEDTDPHSCCISPDGKYFLTGAMGTHKVVSYPIAEDGTLGDKCAEVDQPSACSIVFDVL